MYFKIYFMKNILLTSLFLFMGLSVAAQGDYDPNTKYAVTTTDGKVYVGYILQDDGREILLNTNNLGKVYIAKSQIQKIVQVDDKKDFRGDKYMTGSVFNTRYQFTTNAFPIEKGDNYAAVNLYGPEFHFSAVDKLSVGVMTTWIASPFVLALKYTFETENEKLNYGIGSLIGTSGYLNQGRGFGSLNWGMITYGDKMFNATLSAGYGFFNWDFFANQFFKPGIYAPTETPPTMITGMRGGLQGPLVGLGTMTTVSDRVTLIFDLMYVKSTRNRYDQVANFNYDNGVLVSSEYTLPNSYALLTTNFFVFMPAIRFQTKPNRAFQFALAGVVGNRTTKYNFGTNFRDEFSFPIPSCTWYYKF